MGSDTDRRELHEALQQHLGERPATILMDLLPPVGYADLVRQSDFHALHAEMRGEFSAVRGEIAALRSELKGEIAELRGEIVGVRGEIVGVRSELKGDIAELRGEIAGVRGQVQGLIGKFLAAAIPLMFGFAGLVLAAVKLA